MANRLEDIRDRPPGTEGQLVQSSERFRLRGFASAYSPWLALAFLGLVMVLFISVFEECRDGHRPGAELRRSPPID